MFSVSSSLSSSPSFSAPPRVASKATAPTAHQQREGGLFIVSASAENKAILEQVLDFLPSLTPEIIPFKAEYTIGEGTGAKNHQYVKTFGTQDSTGLLIMTEEHLKIAEALRLLETNFHVICQDSSEGIQAMKDRALNLMFNQVKQEHKYEGVESKDDILTMTRGILNDMGIPWDDQNIAKVKTQIKAYFPLLKEN
ncbi:MAG: hypothetical protein ACK5T0_01510 [Vampirovibrionales bacterium]|jgi:hypothetical protein